MSVIFMSTLKAALPTIFLHEGRYVDDKDDKGGATNYGISLAFLKTTTDKDGDGKQDGDLNSDGLIDIRDTKLVDDNKAAHLYDVYWWSNYDYGRIASQDVATKIFDLAINMGASQAHKIAQRAVRAVNGKILKEDGVLGSVSFASINTLDNNEYFCALKSEAAGFYRSLNQPKFLKGWLNRAYSNPVKA